MRDTGTAETPRLVLDQPGGNLALDAFVLSQHVGALLARALAGTDVSPSQYAVYAQLTDGPRRPGDIIAALGIAGPTLSGYLTAMTAGGHLTRRRNVADRRSVEVELTAAGHEVRRACQLRTRRAVGAITAQLEGAEDVAALRAALGRLDRAVLAATDLLDA